MKRKLIALFLAACLLFSLPVLANGLDPLARVVDNAGLLTKEEASTLESRINDILYEYDMDIVILTVDSLGGRSATAYADDYYDDHGYGTDGNHSGLLLLVAMEEREWAVSTCGDAIRTVTDAEIDDIMDYIFDDLSGGYYYDAFDAFLDQVEAEYRAGIDAATVDMGNIITRFLIALAIGAAIAGIALLVMRSKMNTAKAQRGAGSYMVQNSYDLYRIQDFYLYSHTSKVRKAENNSSGTHRSSSGRSHGGRSGRF